MNPVLILVSFWWEKTIFSLDGDQSNELTEKSPDVIFFNDFLFLLFLTYI